MPKVRDPHAATRARHRARAEELGCSWNELATRGSWGPDSAPLLWTWDWGGLVVLGVARWEYQVCVRTREGACVVEVLEEPEAEGDPRDQALRRYGTVERAGFVLVVDEEGLRSWRPPAGADHQEDVPVFRGDSTRGTRFRPPGAEWLWRRRGELERDGVFTASAWCTRCGSYFEDTRVALGTVQRIARWCSTCRPRRTRRLPPYRGCAAADCSVVFQPPRGNAIYCSGRCCSAANARSPQSAS